jgi:hypothetical protein
VLLGAAFSCSRLVASFLNVWVLAKPNLE